MHLRGDIYASGVKINNQMANDRRAPLRERERAEAKAKEREILMPKNRTKRRGRSSCPAQILL